MMSEDKRKKNPDNQATPDNRDNQGDDFAQRVLLFKKEVHTARGEYYACLKEGNFPDTLSAKIKDLLKQRDALLFAALPDIRRKVLDTRDPCIRLDTLVRAREDGVMQGEITKEQLREAGLSEHEEALVGALFDSVPAEPDIPEDAGFDPSQYACMFYLFAGNDNTAFLFGDDGTVLLFEYNNGWQMRKDPVLKDCLAENALMESDASCLILDADHQVVRLSYDRLDSPEKVLGLPLYLKAV